MAGRYGRVPGGVMRTYARLRPLRRVEHQKWFSPADQKHLFSSSSSHLDSSREASSPEDPDFTPSIRKVNLKPESRTLSRRRKKKRSGLQPRRKSRKKLHSIAQCNDGEKENDERLRPSAASSPVVFSTPFRKFVTVRRKAAAAGETMEPLRRGVPPLLSPDSLGDIEADGLTLRKRRRLCTDVSNVLSSTPQTLQKAPLLSSTPSVTLTAMPRKGNAFVRQLALSEALEDSVVLCGADPPCDVSERASPQRLRMTSPEETCPVTSRDGAGSGVKQLVIKTLSSVCLLSPVMVSSPESQSVVFIRDGALGSGLQEGGASAELFSKDFTVDNEETTPAPHHNLETPAPHHNLETRPRPCTFTPSKWKDFRRKPFQPFVPLNPRIVAEYVVQKSKGPLHELRAPLPGVSAPVVPSMQPLVRLDPAAVSNYYLKKELEKPQTLPRSTADPITPQGRTSVLKDPEQDDVDPQTMATGRKVCISGFSAKRWGTLRKKPPSTKAQQQLSFQDRSREDRCGGDLHSASLLFSSSLLTSSFLNSTAALNLNLSTDSLTTRDPQKEHQRWARLRAALSLHRRKKVEAGSPSSHPVRRRNGGNVSLSSHNSSLLLLSPFQSHLCAQELTDAEKVFAECQQDKPIPFYECLSRDQLCCCHKVGEGVYGEVFRTLRGGQHVALKVIPIEGSLKINGEHQKSFAEILPEIIISKELSLLSEGVENRTSGFIQLHSAHCVQGSYPSELLSAWDTFSEEKGTENERPDLFGPEQLFMILEFEFGGEDLEQASCKLPSVAASRSILHQVTAALAVAEEELRFEHRDLHWGNLLIEKSSSCTLAVNLQGEMLEIPSAGIQVKIIDYTLSRLDKDGLTVFCDLSTDEELFLGEGDLQFEVYRKMRQENQNVWSLYKPHSNVLWLHYLCDKLLSQVSYIKKPTSAAQRRDLRRLQDFRREVQQFGSATEVLKRSRLFK